MKKYFVISLLMCCVPASLVAQDSGFLSDYSRLEVKPDTGFTRVYIKPGVEDGPYRYVELDARILEFPERHAGGVQIRHEGRLRDLQMKLITRDPLVVQNLQHALDHIGLGKLPTRNVHAHR